MFNDLTPEERKTLIIWGIIGLIIFFVAVLFKIFVVNKEDIKEYNEPHKIVKDYSRYYTVNAALTKYYSFINAKNYKSVINILDSNYVFENKIDEKNIKEYITISEIDISYKTGMMCSKDIAEGLTSYYVEGTEVSMNTAKYLNKIYYEVVLDGNNLVFSVKPITSEVYGGNCHE